MEENKNNLQEVANNENVGNGKLNIFSFIFKNHQLRKIVHQKR